MQENWSIPARDGDWVPKNPDHAAKKGNFFFFYSTLFHLPPLRIHCVGGRWDRTQGSCDYGIGSQTL
jgi:hypothetical protein